MVQVKVNPNLTEEDVPALVAELEKLSSLNPVKDKLLAAGKSLEPLPSEKMVGSRPRENEVFLKDYVEGAYELAVMLGIEDQCTIGPSKGLSFRASNHKFYDFMTYWSALIKRFSKIEDRLGVFDIETDALCTRMYEAEQENKSQALLMRSLFDYAFESRQRSDKKIEALEAKTNEFEEIAEIVIEHVDDFTKTVEQLGKVDSEIYLKLIQANTQIKKLKKQIFWFVVWSAIPTFYLYGEIILKFIK